MNRNFMRKFQFGALAITAFAGTMTVKAPETNAVVYCAAGVYRAGWRRPSRGRAHGQGGCPAHG
jgi:hypothetical protein